MDFSARPDFWAHLAIPFIAGTIGWITNWLAVKMTFHPTEFIGIKPFLGWQGIIPAKVEKMAAIVVDKSLSKLGSLDEFFREMEPEKIASHVSKVTQARIEEYIDEVMTDKNAVLWENLPVIVKKRVYQRVKRQVPEIMESLVKDISENIEDLVDLKHMITTLLSDDKVLLNRVFLEVGEPEFRFVINSGFYFGFLFGLIQLAVYIQYPEDWVNPFFGFLVGTATNWLALNVIFRPLNPVKVGPFRVQGLFLKRQPDVAQTFARLSTQEFMTVKNIMTAVMTGPRSHRTRAIIKKNIRPLVDGGVVRTAAQLTVGMGGYAHLKKVIEDKAIGMSLDPFDDPVFNKERGVIVERLFRDRMAALSAEEFQDLLRPAFQEDEWILILIGGVLGAVAGLLQWTLMMAMAAV
jgi:uncharacterized membrane protein YheB (UPF0754 family)